MLSLCGGQIQFQLKLSWGFDNILKKINYNGMDFTIYEKFEVKFVKTNGLKNSLNPKDLEKNLIK